MLSFMCTQTAFEGSITDIQLSQSLMIKWVCQNVVSLVWLGYYCSVISISLCFTTVQCTTTENLFHNSVLSCDTPSVRKLIPVGLGRRTEETAAVKSSLDFPVCVEMNHMSMCVAFIFEHLTPCLTPCQHPLPCVCVEACNSLLQICSKFRAAISCFLPLCPISLWSLLPADLLHTLKTHIDT